MMSEERTHQTVGVLPALASGLTDLRRTGQHERLLEYDLRRYSEAYDRVLYFSYFHETLAEFTRDPLLLERVTVLPKRGPWSSRIYSLLLPFLYRDQFRRCEVLRVLQFPGVIPALVARLLYGTPFVVTYGYHYGEVARLAGSRVKPWLYRVLEHLAFPRAAGVIVTSTEMQRLLERHPRRPRLAYFPNGVDTRRFAPVGPGARNPTRRQVLYAGRLEIEKNVARLIDALATIDEPPVRLVVIGDGTLRDELVQRAGRAGLQVDFKGVVPHAELPRHFRDADCFVLPSLTEGHPKILVEAMACGVPCAAAARGGIPSIVQDGVTGLLFDPENTENIAGAIRRILADEPLARRLGAKARATAVALYDEGVILAREAAFVQSVSRAAPLKELFEDYARTVPMDAVVPDFVSTRLRQLGGPVPRAVLDLGAGDGRYLAFLSGLFAPGTLLVGCELSDVRAFRLKAQGFPVVIAQAEALPFRGGAFDLITLMEVIEHTRFPDRALDEARRTLAPHGQLILTTPNYPMKRLFDLRAALRQRNLARLHDDPTHISPLSAGRLERLLLPRFEVVRLEGTAIPGEGSLRWLGRLRRSRVGRRLSNKLFAICAKREPQA
jgi:glycosyltransferase involved in cell wall biosynthesis